jgi:hypothetical protein
VSNDQTGKTISTALADIIETDTPVEFVPGNVSVGDDTELTRPLQGEPVESVLRLLSFASENEAFGVNRQREFFFRPRETRHIDRGISNTQWFDYDIPELGKRALNEVEVFFDNGNKSVIVDNPDDKLDLQDSLNLQDPGTQRKEVSRPSITDIQDAEDVGRKILKFRNTTLTGEVTTFGLFNASPGDTIDIEIDARGISDEFLIAAAEYQWGRDETIITIVEQRGDVDDLLIDINDSVKRQETQDANRNAPKNRITSTTAGAIVDPTVDLDGVPVDDARIVNDGRRAIRDGLAGNSLPDITDIAVGDDGTGLSRSNTALRNETARAGVTQTLAPNTVTFEATLSQSGVREVGLLTASNTLIARATVDTPTSVNGPVTVTLDVRNDERPSRSVLTNAGQTSVRDVLADNNPGLPTRYAYGSDDTPVSETDTALGNQVTSVDATSLFVQEASTTAEFTNITDIPFNQPADIENNQIVLLQSAFVGEGEDTTGFTESGSQFSGGEAGVIAGPSFTDITLTFDIDYFVPNSSAEIYIRSQQGRSSTSDPTPTTVNVLFDGQTVQAGSDIIIGPTQPDISWEQFDIDSNQGDVARGNHTVTVEFNRPQDNNQQFIDVIAFVDTRRKLFGATPDNTLNTPGGFLDGPQLFTVFDVEFDQATARRDFRTGTLDFDFNDTSNFQRVEVSRGAVRRRFSNQETADFDLGAESPRATAGARLSGFENGPRQATPRFGYLGQSIDSYELISDTNQPTTDDINEALTRAVIPPNTATGSTFREAGLLDGNGNLLTRHILAEFDVLQDQRVASSETTTINETE